MIAIVNYESARTQEIRDAFAGIDVDADIVASIDRVDRASRIVLPPAASLARAIRAVRDAGIIPSLMRAIDQGRPLLGIGHGLHLLFDVSYEEGQHTGLGVIPGKVTGFDFAGHPVGRSTRVPHQGWSQVTWLNGCPLFAGLKSGQEFYFDHAYHAEPLDHRLVAATCSHGIDFSAAVWNGPVFGVQFLPEKSGEAGLQLLKNFASL